MSTIAFVLAVASFLFSLIYWIRSSSQPIIDFHSFRQSQTAISARWIFSEGSGFLDYQTPVLGKPWSIPFEFPLYQAIVNLSSALFRGDLTTAGRLINAAFTMLSFCISVQILRLFRLNVLPIYCFTILFFSSHIYTYWGRSVTIEGVSLFFTLLSLYIYILRRIRFVSEKAKPSLPFDLFSLLVLFLSYSFATAIKVTTAFALIAWAACDLIYIKIDVSKAQSTDQSERLFANSFLSSLSLFFSFAVGLIWTGYADSLKSQNIYASSLTSKALQGWNFGAGSQRFEVWRWKQLIHWSFPYDTHYLIALILVVSIIIVNLASFRKESAFGSSKLYLLNLSLFSFCLPPLVFFNLYVVHDYYSYANLVYFYMALAAMIGAFADSTLRSPACEFLCFVIVALTMLISCAQLSSFFSHYYPESMKQSSPELAASVQIKNYSRPRDRLLTIADHWSSQLFYLSNLKGLSIPNHNSLIEASTLGSIANMLEGGDSCLFVLDKSLVGLSSDQYSKLLSMDCDTLPKMPVGIHAYYCRK